MVIDQVFVVQNRTVTVRFDVVSASCILINRKWLSEIRKKDIEKKEIEEIEKKIEENQIN